MSEIIKTALEKLEKESTNSGVNNNVPAIPIYEHLKKRCEQDADFAALVAVSENTLQKCFEYIYSVVEKQVKERKGTQSVWYSDEKTYETAEEYYRIGEIELERRRQEKKKAEEEARERQRIERERIAAEKKSKKGKKTNAKEKPSEPAKSKEPPKPEVSQISLFDEGE